MYPNPQNRNIPRHRDAARQADPYMYASIVGAFLHDRNPVQVLVGDFQRMISVLANLGKNRSLAQKRINQLQEQVARVESQISSVNPRTAGNRLDSLR